MKKTWEAFKGLFGLKALEKQIERDKDALMDREKFVAQMAKKQRDARILNMAGQFVVAQALRGIHPMEDGNWIQAVEAAERMVDYATGDQDKPENPDDIL